MHSTYGPGLLENTDFPVVMDVEFAKAGEVDFTMAEKGS